jgi:hypothetical protein
MDAVLGIIFLLIYVAAIIGLAAGITWLVIKVSPARDKPKGEKAAEA